MFLRNELGKYLSEEIVQIVTREKLEESKRRFRMSRRRENQEEPHERSRKSEEWGVGEERGEGNK